MYKLLNRFAWIISIILTISIVAIDDDFFFIAIIFGLITKFVIFSDNFIKERLDFFADAIKKEYLIQPGNLKEELKNESFIRNEEKEILEEKEIKNIGIAVKNSFETAEMPKKHIPNNVEIFFAKLGTYIKEFFSTNILAKLGGILLLLMVVYFLKGIALDIWNVIGVIGRITIGIIIGFLVYFTGMKLHKKYPSEGLILMGTGILINYAVILSGRYLVPEASFITSELVVSVFLILNTIFGVITSLTYKSRTLLIFSFLFAYTIPFIIVAKEQSEPYTLIIYSLIISFGALFLAKKQNNLTLLIISFVLGNLLFLVADFSNSFGWSIKLIFTTIFSIFAIFITHKLKEIKFSTNKIVLSLFLGTYVFIILNLFNSGNILSETFSFLVYNIILVGLFIFSIYFVKSFIKDENSEIVSIFLIPFLIIIFILFSGKLIFSPFILVLFLILFLVGFVSIEKKVSNYYKYFSFIFLGIFIFLFNFKLNIIGSVDISGIDKYNYIEFFTILFSSFVFLFFSYFYSRKKSLEALFPIGTIGTIFILVPIIINKTTLLNGNNIEFYLSILAIIIFAIANLVLPFINKKLLEKQNLYNLVIGTVAGALFLSFQIYNYGEIYFPGIIEGFAFLALAIIYFLQAYSFMQKIGIEKIKADSDLQNIFYTFAGVSISLFSVSMAFVFSKYPEIITTVWLFEATILYYIFSKNNSKKIFFAATILFFIGLTKFGILIDVVQQKDFMFLVSFSVIFTSFILNLFFINKSENNFLENKNIGFGKNIHFILHIIGMIIMGILLYEIIPSNGHGWSKFAISIFITILGFFYAKFSFKFLKIVFIILILGFSIFHIGDIEIIFNKLENKDIEYLKILQYFVTGILVSNIFIWKKFNISKKEGISKKINLSLKIILGIYAFLISNIYILNIFENSLKHFSLTLYWGLIASILLIYGIQKDLQKFRTIGLYFLVLTIGKIFLFDVWQVGDITWRYIIFGILGVILIIISTLYTKRYGDNLLKEFKFDNMKDKNGDEDDINNFGINNDIKNMDVSEIKYVTFLFKNNEKVSIKAVNLIKIVKSTINQLAGQTVFEKEELRDVYEFIKENYKSELSKTNYNKIINILEKFIKEGGEIILEKK